MQTVNGLLGLVGSHRPCRRERDSSGRDGVVVEPAEQGELVEPVASASGKPSTPLPVKDTICPNFLSALSSTAFVPKVVQRALSIFVGLPPRCKCPRTTQRVSLPVRLPISSVT